MVDAFLSGRNFLENSNLLRDILFGRTFVFLDGGKVFEEFRRTDLFQGFRYPMTEPPPESSSTADSGEGEKVLEVKIHSQQELQ